MSNTLNNDYTLIQDHAAEDFAIASGKIKTKVGLVLNVSGPSTIAPVDPLKSAIQVDTAQAANGFVSAIWDPATNTYQNVGAVLLSADRGTGIIVEKTASDNSIRAYIGGQDAGVTDANHTSFGANANVGAASDNVSAFGTNANFKNAGIFSTAMGANSNYASTGDYATAVGVDANYLSTGESATAVGVNANRSNVGVTVTGVGANANSTSVGDYVTGVGANANYQNKADAVTGVGVNANYQNKNTNATAVGVNANYCNSGLNATAMGVNSNLQNTGTNSTAIGLNANYQNTSDHVTGVGVNANYLSASANATAVGVNANYYNLGAGATGLGFNSNYHNLGSNVTSSGVSSNYENMGDNSTAIGFNTGSRNTGKNNTSIGFDAFTLQSGYQNTALGASSFKTAQITFKPIKSSAVDVAGNKITIPSHGLGSSGSIVNLIASGTPPTPISAGSYYFYTIIDANTIAPIVPLTANTSGSFTLLGTVQVSNSTAVGFNASPTKDNQIVLGDNNAVEIKTVATSVITGVYPQFLTDTAASAALVKGQLYHLIKDPIVRQVL